MSEKLPRLPHGQGADIGLLLEGTYPYVSGGVSSWVHEIISGLPDLSFGIVFIGSSPEDYKPIRYKLPPNLVHVETHYLSEQPTPRKLGSSGKKQQDFDQLAKLHDEFRKPGANISDSLREAVGKIETPDGIGWRDFLYSDQTWHQICASYHKFCTSPSFVDYFWTVRTMHGPLFKMGEIAASVPSFKVLHSVSTGYAGFLGSLLQQRRRCPFILTEHGIYTKERKIDLANADWIKDAREELSSGLEEDRTYVRRLWVRFFEDIGRLAYAGADPIISLYEGNRQRQVVDGAPEVADPGDPQRHRSGPLHPDAPAQGREGATRAGPDRPGGAHQGHPRLRPGDARGGVGAARRRGLDRRAGGRDPEYARDCHDLVRSLGLEGRVKFLGFQKPDEIFPKMGLTVLTSISEALPLVVLESFASGVPVVATDVGSCRELIEGRLPEDRALGSAGAVIPIAAPDEAAAAMVSLLKDPMAWFRAREAGLQRVNTYYTRQQMFDAYRGVYKTALEAVGPASRAVR